MKMSPPSCKFCSQNRRLINARYLSMQTRACTLKIVALKSQIFTLVYSKMTKYVPNPKSSIGNTILQAVLCAVCSQNRCLIDEPYAGCFYIHSCYMYEYTVPVDYYICPYAYMMIPVPWLSKMLVVRPETALEESGQLLLPVCDWLLILMNMMED